MKKILLILSMALLTSCSPWKNYYIVDQVRATKISNRNIKKISRETPVDLDVLRASKGFFLILDQGEFKFVSPTIFNAVYRRKKYLRKK